MNHPLTEKILEEFEDIEKMIENEVLYRYDNLKNANDSANVLKKASKVFLLSAIKRTANEFRVEEKKGLKIPNDVWEKTFNVGYNQCAKETNAKVDKFNPTT